MGTRFLLWKCIMIEVFCVKDEEKLDENNSERNVDKPVETLIVEYNDTITNIPYTKEWIKKKR